MEILAVLQLITQVAFESEVAVSAVGKLVRGVRDSWSYGEGETRPDDATVIAMMKAQAGKNRARNPQLIREIEESMQPSAGGGDEG
jgi:hypothetical protein